MSASTQTSPDLLKDPAAAWRGFAVSLMEQMVADGLYLDPAERGAAAERMKQDFSVAASSPSIAEQLSAAQRIADVFTGQVRETRQSVEAALAGFPAVFETVAALAETSDLVFSPADLGHAPERLMDALTALRMRTDEKRRQQVTLIDDLQNRISILEKINGERGPANDSGLAFALDACTGLPGVEEAEASLREAVNAPAGALQKFAVVFYVHRLNLINKKYGHVVGDSILLLSSQHVATRIIRQADALFRWTGPAFLGILEREEPASVIKSEVNRVLAATLERYFESQDRSVFLPIRLTGQVFEIRGRTVAEICDDVGTFILRASEQS